MSNVERTCKVCGRPESQAGPLLIAADFGHVVAGGFKPEAPVPTSDPRQVVDYDLAGREVHPGDLVCWSHTAIRPNGDYVRVEDGA